MTLGSILGIRGRLLGELLPLLVVLDQFTKAFDHLSMKLRFLHSVLRVHSTKRAESESVHYCSVKGPPCRNPRQASNLRNGYMTCAVPWVTERTQCAISCCIGRNVTHRMRVRLTVRYRTLDCAVRQALFMVGSHIRHLHLVSNLVVLQVDWLSKPGDFTQNPGRRVNERNGDFSPIDSLALRCALGHHRTSKCDPSH